SNFLQSIVLLDLLIALDELDFDDLVNDLQTHLLKHGTQWIRDNFVAFYRASFQHQTFTKLIDFMNKVIQHEPELLLNSECFNELDESELLSILKREDFYVQDETELWKLIITWCCAQQKKILSKDPSKWSEEEINSMKSTLKDIIPEIRFLQCHHINFIRKSMLLNHKQVREIYKKTYSKKYFLKSYPANNPYTMTFLEPTQREVLGTDPTLTAFRISDSDYIIGGYNPFKSKYSSISYEPSFKAKAEYGFMFKIDCSGKIEFVSIKRALDFNLKYNEIKPLNIFDFTFQGNNRIYYKQNFYYGLLENNYYDIEGLEIFKVIEKSLNSTF
ncbi:15949_t:CDS:2, partial [Dentiscutata erythropus]